METLATSASLQVSGAIRGACISENSSRAFL
jgi:hypothetical protein